MAAPSATKAVPSKNAARPTTKAQVRYVRMSASKARQVLDLIRGKSVTQADEVLALSERDAGRVIQKCLRSAVANAEHNDGLDPDELFVATCFADEGPTLRRFRPRARGRATRIRKRTCHITVVVGRYDADELAVIRESERTKGGGGKARGRAATASRRARVARSRGEEVTEEATDEATDEVEETPTTMAEEAAGTAAEGAETVDEALEEVTDLVEESDEVEETEETEETEAADETEATAEAEVGEDLVEDHTKDELLAIAEEAGVEVAKSATKGEIADAISVATASADELADAYHKDELLELAEKAGVEVAKSWTKPQIAEAIVAAREDD